MVLKWVKMVSKVISLCLLCSVATFGLPMDDSQTANHETKENYITLTLDWAMNLGAWGLPAFCPTDSFAYGFEIKVESEAAADDTALNAIQLFCGSFSSSSPSDKSSKEFSITSTEGQWGDWRGNRKCSTGWLTGLRMRSEPDQGLGDDTAANDLEMQCNWGTETHEGGGEHWGHYSSWSTCPTGWAICGLETRVEPDVASDDTALNDVRTFCCQLPPMSTESA